LQINIIDTCTHENSGFTVDLQRTLCVLDGAVLVLCSVLGVERESKTMDEHMIAYEIPRLVFIDKLDQKGANPWEVLNQVNLRLMEVILDSRFCSFISI
jgi:elongation factor G